MQMQRKSLQTHWGKEEVGRIKGSTDIHTRLCVSPRASGKLCNTGSAARRSVMAERSGTGGVGREFKKERICVYLWLIHLDLQQKLTQHRKAIRLQSKKKVIHFYSFAYTQRISGRTNNKLITSGVDLKGGMQTWE